MNVAPQDRQEIAETATLIPFGKNQVGVVERLELFQHLPERWGCRAGGKKQVNFVDTSGIQRSRDRLQLDSVVRACPGRVEKEEFPITEPVQGRLHTVGIADHFNWDFKYVGETTKLFGGPDAEGIE